jgi:hypothetical protein
MSHRLHTQMAPSWYMTRRHIPHSATDSDSRALPKAVMSRRNRSLLPDVWLRPGPTRSAAITPTVSVPQKTAVVISNNGQIPWVNRLNMRTPAMIPPPVRPTLRIRTTFLVACSDDTNRVLGEIGPNVSIEDPNGYQPDRPYRHMCALGESNILLVVGVHEALFLPLDRLQDSA